MQEIKNRISIIRHIFLYKNRTGTTYPIIQGREKKWGYFFSHLQIEIIFILFYNQKELENKIKMSFYKSPFFFK